MINNIEVIIMEPVTAIFLVLALWAAIPSDPVCYVEKITVDNHIVSIPVNCEDVKIKE